MQDKSASMTWNMLWSRWSAYGALALCLFLLLDSSPLCAQSAPRRLSVLNAAVAGVDQARLEKVDVALREALSTHSEFALVQTSAVPFEDVELAAGCGPEQGSCLQLIATQLGTEALLVRRLSALSDASATLTLIVADAPAQGGATRQAGAEIVWSEPQGAERVVHQVLAELFPPPPAALMPESLALAPEPPSSTHTERPRWRFRLGASLTAIGGGLLVAGLTSGILARHSEREYGHATTRNVEEVDHAHALFTNAERRARIANGMLGAGAVVMVLGLGTMVGDWVALRGTKGSAELSLQPTRAGLMVSLAGSWSGGT